MLPLDDPRTDVLGRLQARMIQRFGRIDRAAADWRKPEWVLVQGVIGARTLTPTSNAATERLFARYGSWDAVAAAPLGELEAELATQTYPDIAAARVKSALGGVIERVGRMDLSHLGALATEDAMAWLESLPGVGRKVAAGVMNASTFDRRVLVLDSHHIRVSQRMKLVPPRADTIRAFDSLMPAMPPEWTASEFDEHHLLMKKLGQQFCRPAAPLCAECPALSLCPTGTARVPGR